MIRAVRVALRRLREVLGVCPDPGRFARSGERRPLEVGLVRTEVVPRRANGEDVFGGGGREG